MKYVDPGAHAYESRYRERVVKQLHRRAAQFGFRSSGPMPFLRKAAAYFAKESL